jgi:hypothetical protein
MRDHRSRTASRGLLSAVILVGLAAFLMPPKAAQAQCLRGIGFPPNLTELRHQVERLFCRHPGAKS